MACHAAGKHVATIWREKEHMQQVHLSQDPPANAFPGAHVGVRRASANNWQARAVDAYRCAEANNTGSPRLALAAAVHQLTGQSIPSEAIVEDREHMLATGTVDGITFRLTRVGLLLLRPCVYCGTGQFKSIPLQSEADLGYALAIWRPLHEMCLQCDPDEMMDTSW